VPSDTALVTGGAGFIGSHVARAACEMGLDVVALDDLSGGFRDNVPPKARFVEGDITDVPLITDLFKNYRFRYVYHLAAYAAENLSHFIRIFNYTNNLVGSANLINASVRHEVDCFVFTSSIAVYGTCPPPMREDQQPEPEDPYGIAKAAVERDLCASHKLFGLPFVIFRPHNVYGPGQNIGDRYRNVVGIFMNCIMQNQPMPIFGSGKQSRAFSYIDDVAPCIAKSPQIEACLGEVFNIGADEPTTVEQLALIVAEAMQVEPNIIRHPVRSEVLHAYASHEKFRKVFQPQPPVPLREGVQRTAEWAKRSGPRKSKPFSNIEIEKGLPPAWLEV